MQTQYFKEYSRFLKRDFEFKVYGHSGQPCLAFACENGRFFDWEDRGMTAALNDLIESGKIQLFCADSVDSESWLGQNDPRLRIETQERWFNYVCGELAPRILELNAEAGTAHTKILPIGIGLGAGHAVTVSLRCPKLFLGAIGLSGSYTPDGWFGSYTDDLILRNSPLDLLRLMSASKASDFATPFLLCCGQGAYEERFLKETKELVEALKQHHLPFEFELLGTDIGHDWSWWKTCAPLLLKKALKNL